MYVRMCMYVCVRFITTQNLAQELNSALQTVLQFDDDGTFTFMPRSLARSLARSLHDDDDDDDDDDESVSQSASSVGEIRACVRACVRARVRACVRACVPIHPRHSKNSPHMHFCYFACGMLQLIVPALGAKRLPTGRLVGRVCSSTQRSRLAAESERRHEPQAVDFGERHRAAIHQHAELVPQRLW